MRQAVLAAVLGVAAACPALSEVTLSADSLRKAASISLQQGDVVRAQAYAEALLERDPKDLTAHLIRARALRDQGKVTPAREAARHAWALAETDAQRYSAALITAQVLSSMGKRARAQFWLRRAVQLAPDTRLEARAKRDFRYVRARNPWSTQMSFVLAPNSNINNGSAQERSYLNYAVTEALFGEPVEYGLSGSAQALSGLEWGGTLHARYRFAETPTSAQDLKFGLSYRSFILSSGARNQAPGLSGSDFSFGTVSFGYGHRTRNFQRKGELLSDLEVGQSWYGGARYASYLRGSMRQTYRTSARRQLSFGVNAERLLGQATPDVDTIAFSTSLTERFSSGNIGYVGLAFETTHSVNAGSEYGEIELRSGYVLGKPVLGTALQIGLGTAWRDYDVSPHARGGRQDTRIFADLTATFTDFDYYGFNPSVTITASRTNSNIGLFDTRRLGVSLGITSAF